MKLQKGFTLVELMIVVVIIGILASVSIPAYSNYVLRGKIPDATSNLAIKRTAMEQYFQDNRTYLSGLACPSSVAPSSSTYFTFTCSVATATTYTLTATGITTTGTGGFSYTIDQSNAKTSTIAAPASTGWQSAVQPCWITKPGGVC